MDDRFTPRPVAGWYMIGAVASLLFMALGCWSLALQFGSDPASLAPDQRALFEAEPQWVLGASAVGFIAGLIGGLLLILRRKAAVPAMLVSLAGIAIWFAGMFVAPRFRDLLSMNEIAVALVLVAITWTIYWFARHSRQRGWLR